MSLVQAWLSHPSFTHGAAITVPVQRLIGREGQRGGNPAAAVVAVSLPLDGPDDLAAANAALDAFLASQQGHAAALAMAADDVRPPHRN